MATVNFHELLATAPNLLANGQLVSYKTLEPADKKRVCATVALELIRAEAASSHECPALTVNLGRLEDMTTKIMAVLG